MTIMCIIWIAALICWILAGIGRCPQWVAGILTAIAGLASCLPLH